MPWPVISPPTKTQEYGDQAMRMLCFAMQSGYKNAADIAKDKDLDVLRGHPHALHAPARPPLPPCPL